MREILGSESPAAIEYFLLVGIFGFLAIISLIVGVPSSAEVFGGFAFVWLALAYTSSGTFVPKKFIAFHVFLILGLFLLLIGIDARIPLVSVNLFEFGSFALIVSTFLLAKEGELPDFYFSILFRSVTATSLFFIAGGFFAFNEILSSTPKPTPPNPYVVLALGSFFLVAIIDLLIVGFEFYSVLYDRYTTQNPWQEVP